jgi:hypothetical protein
MRALEAKEVKRSFTSTVPDRLNTGLAVKPKEAVEVLAIPLLPAKSKTPGVDPIGVHEMLDPTIATEELSLDEIPDWQGNLSDWVAERGSKASKRNMISFELQIIR